MELERRSPNSSMLKTSLSKNSVPRSPLPRSPMPKSPFPYSPVPKSPELYEKYKSRCVYCLISFFHFRHNHSKKLISDADKETLKKISQGDGYIQNRLDLHSDNSIHDGAQKKTPRNSGYAKVKKIKGEDVSIDLQKKKKITTAKVENIQYDSQLHDGRSRSPRKSTKSRRTRRLPIYGCYDVSTMDHGDIPNHTLAERDHSSKSLDSAISAEVQVCSDDNIMQHDPPSEINLQVNMNEATEACINQKLIDGKHLIADGENHRSKDFLDALKILNSNKDLFVKLLQDPNSLLVKHIEELRDSQEKKQQIKLSTKAELSKFQTRNTRECIQPLEKIVVIRPNSKRLENCADSNDDSSQVHYSLRSVEQSVKPAHFSFEQMKRKLMHAIRVSRKEQQIMLIDNRLHDKSIHDFEVRGRCGEETVLGSANRNLSEESSSDFEGMIKPSIRVNKKDEMDKEGQFVTVIRDHAVSACESSNENSYLERNEHSVDINNSGFSNENTNLLKRECVKISDSKLLPEHDILPVVSPRMRFSSFCYHHIASENNRNQKERTDSCSTLVRQKEEAVCRKQMQEQETSNSISSNCFHDDEEHEISSLLSNDSSHKEKTCSENSEESIPSVLPSQPDDSPNNYINQSSEMVDSSEDRGSLDFSREASPIKNQTSTSSIGDYSSSPLKNQRFEAFDMNKQTEQPSPVSVLDKFMADDINNSPSNTKPVIADPPSVSLLPIGIKEGCLATSTTEQCQLSLNNINSIISTEEYKPPFEYVTTLLQACHFDWDELMKKYFFSDQLLDQSLLSDKLVHPNEFYGDHGLLFDYVNEVTVEVCRCNLKCSRWLSFLKPRILSATITENIVDEVVKHFDWNLLLAPPSQTLDQIVEKDLTKSRTWMDFRIDAEDAVSEMIDSILEELMIDFAVE